MAFILALMALAACLMCWHFFWADAAFRPYLIGLSDQYGGKGMIVFWLSVVFGVWGLLINSQAPASISLLISAITTALWLSSPKGVKFMNSLI